MADLYIRTRGRAVRAAATWRRLVALSEAVPRMGGAAPAILKQVARHYRREAKDSKTALDGYIARHGGSL